MAIDATSLPALWSGPGERLRRWRDRLLADPEFQRRAAHFPATRWLARRRARALFDLCAGFVYAQVLSACVRLDLFARLAEGPRTSAEIAALTRIDATGAETLLKAAAALRLVEPRPGGCFGLGALGAALIGNPGLAAMIRHHDLLYRDLADPLAILGAPGSGDLAAYWPYATAGEAAGLGADRVASYGALMAATQPMVAEQILAAYRFDRHRVILDVGGGEGAFLATLGRYCRHTALWLFDLPAVAERARQYLDAAGLGTRARLVGGDFRVETLPAGADCITLVRILHDHDDATVLTLLARAHAALSPGGAIVIAEPMASTPGAEAMGDAYFGLYLRAMGRGRPRTAETYLGMLENAGFRDARRHATAMPLITSVVSAHKRGAS